MLIKLLPEQLVKIWTMLRFAIVETFMPRNSCTSEHLRYILSCLLSGKMQCWIGFSKTLNEDGSKKFIGFLITRIAIEPMTGDKVLSLDHIYAFAPVSDELFKVGMETIEKYATKNGCKYLTALTENDRIGLLSGRLGFSKRTYMFKEV